MLISGLPRNKSLKWWFRSDPSHLNFCPSVSGKAGYGSCCDFFESTRTTKRSNYITNYIKLYTHVDENCWEHYLYIAVACTMLYAIVPVRCKLQDSFPASWLKSCLCMRTIGIFATWFTYTQYIIFRAFGKYITVHEWAYRWLKFKIFSCILQLHSQLEKAEAIHLFLDSDSWLHHRRLQGGAGQRVDSKNSLTVPQRIHKEYWWLYRTFFGVPLIPYCLNQEANFLSITGYGAWTSFLREDYCNSGLQGVAELPVFWSSSVNKEFDWRQGQWDVAQDLSMTDRLFKLACDHNMTIWPRIQGNENETDSTFPQ